MINFVTKILQRWTRQKTNTNFLISTKENVMTKINVLNKNGKAYKTSYVSDADGEQKQATLKDVSIYCENGVRKVKMVKNSKVGPNDVPTDIINFDFDIKYIEKYSAILAVALAKLDQIKRVYKDEDLTADMAAEEFGEHTVVSIKHDTYEDENECEDLDDGFEEEDSSEISW